MKLFYHLPILAGVALAWNYYDDEDELDSSLYIRSQQEARDARELYAREYADLQDYYEGLRAREEQKLFTRAKTQVSKRCWKCNLESMVPIPASKTQGLKLWQCENCEKHYKRCEFCGWNSYDITAEACKNPKCTNPNSKQG